jgi:hypothetical protein
MQVKRNVKRLLFRAGVWYALNRLRTTPEILRWLRSGCTGVAPHAVKMMVVWSYLERRSIKRFVETGTYLGETLGYVARNNIDCVSIELSPTLYELASAQFHRNKNVKILQGDSGERLPEVLETLREPAVFWLDGHYSSGITATGPTATPIMTEVDAILRHPIKRHVILIDDARCFDGTNGYPRIEDLLSWVRAQGSYDAEISIDIIRLTPRSAV